MKNTDNKQLEESENIEPGLFANIITIVIGLILVYGIGDGAYQIFQGHLQDGIMELVALISIIGFVISSITKSEMFQSITGLLTIISGFYFLFKIFSS